MAINYQQAEEFAALTNNKLLNAWETGDREAYTRIYKDFARFFELETLSEDDGFELISSTNGASLGFRHRTSKAEGAEILERARKSQKVFKELPIKLRQGMLIYFLNNTFPKIALAAAVAQTAAMGKAISESKAEVAGKGKSWFDFATTEMVRNYIESYQTRSGFDISTAEGAPITSKAQLGGYKGAVIITKYPDSKTSAPIKAEGSGISIEQPPSNYVALTFPGLTLPILVGNACITKLPTATPDAFEIIRMAFLHDAKQYLIDNKIADYETIIVGLSQSVTNRGWEKVANTFRLVGGMETGYNVYQSRMASNEIYENDKKRTCMELAGDNVLYIHDDISDTELEAIVDNYLARVSSNSGMICTRVNLVMCKAGRIFDKFVSLVEAKISGLEKQIGNPHDFATKQGALINEHECEMFKESLYLNKRAGARVTGGNRVHQDKGGVFISAAVSVWEDKEFYKKIRAEGREIFAPASNIISVSGVEEAAEITNLSNNSLSSAISSHDAKVQEYFITHTKLGSYNINNPKHASDNSAGGAHMGHYPGMAHNGPTGSLAHVAHHLNVELNDPEYSVWMARADADNMLAQFGIKLL